MRYGNVTGDDHRIAVRLADDPLTESLPSEGWQKIKVRIGDPG
jgi:hypothetical protein